MKPEFLTKKLVLRYNFRQWVSKDVNSRKQRQKEKKRAKSIFFYSDGS